MAGHYKQPGYKPTTSITLDEDLFIRIDDFKFKKRFESRSQAITNLILKGLKYEELVQKRKSRNAI
ncbi:MAG: ribbon-helix-helix domain-containing protein [Bacillota bacterium]|nr:ribbon-helix-helix domain-containing protein [Bacillota bacterium]